MYGLLFSSQKLADSTSNRIEAIQIARDGLEAIINIRDTNWTLYAADYKNCWNVLNYESGCIWVSGTTGDINHAVNQWFKIYRDSENKFRLSLWSYSAWDSYTDSSYRAAFAIRKDLSWFYTQSGGTIYGVWSDPFYTREIQVNYIDDSWNLAWSTASDNNTLEAKVTVQWIDTTKQEPQKLEMSTVLTNWKAKK